MLRFYISFFFLCISINVYADIFLSSPKIKLNAQDQRIIEFKIQNGNIKDGDIFLNEYKKYTPLNQQDIAYTLIEDFVDYQTYKIVLSENYQEDYFSFKILIKDEFIKDIFIFLPTKLRNFYREEVQQKPLKKIPINRTIPQQNEIAEIPIIKEEISIPELEIIRAEEITTAWSMSKKIKGENKDISIYQVMWSLYLGNKDAFINENINLIRNDVDLFIPKISEIEEVSYEFAKESILSMNQSFTQSFSSASRSLLVLTAPEVEVDVSQVNDIEIQEEDISSISIDEFENPADIIEKNTKQISVGIENEVANEFINAIEESQETENQNNFGIFDLIFISLISLISGILLALIFIYLRNIRNAKDIQYDFEEAQDDNSLLSSIPAGLSIENDLDQQQYDLAVTYFEMNDQENAKKILNQLIKETENEQIKTDSVNLLNKID